MMIETTRFGSISASENDIITFPEGMLGFSKIDQYVLIERADDSLFMWLQALKKPSVAFPLLEPQILEKTYKVEMLEEDLKVLQLKDLKHAKVFSIITIPTDPSKMTANLKAPVVINLKNHLAKQVILHEMNYPIRKAIFSDLQQYCISTERTIFPSLDIGAYQTIPISEQGLNQARKNRPEINR
ncbi:MAG: flagellar assembly protein FliW [Proteobacteria bacterium]|nr:flagellar assembly protein FliW [Pseudomonadota bacterium]NDG27632.1 flagellar assembly protein FliW [Pseudomonadota bacterium]